MAEMYKALLSAWCLVVVVGGMVCWKRRGDPSPRHS